MNQPAPQIKNWTTKDVHQWLMTEVKVHRSCADRFTDEDVQGEYLVHFEKKDILELGIKHGPAVKISSYLKRLKEGSKYQSQYPAYVEKWTKEQVNQWLVDHAKVYGKYADRLQKEDVSGDCLVCFNKHDLLDVDVKSGPAVKILAELKALKSKPEPILQQNLPISRDLENSELCSESGSGLAQFSDIQQQESLNKKGSGTKEKIQSAHDKKQLPNESNPLKQKEITKEKTSPNALVGKETALIHPQPDLPQITKVIQKHMENLLADDFKKFHFQLERYTKSQHDPIARGKLENKDRVDTTKLINDHYGSEEALRITLDILKEIGQHDLAVHLEGDIGQLKLQCLSKDILKKEGNQGDKLKKLLTCGGNSLDNYDSFVVVVNKSSREQVQYLQFLTKLKLFCVLDFDPNSAAQGGLCHSYRESRVANLHTPLQYQGQTDSVIKNLNLYQQTSWVFCNGRHDLVSNTNKELDYRNWLRKACGDVEQLVLFICNPEVFCNGRSLVIFLLLSLVDTEKDPMFDTYKSFLKHTEEESIISICESQGVYEKWRELIHGKCDSDIDPLSIYELTLSEINGTIMAIGPFSQSSGKLLPSTDSSAVVLKQKDEDLMTTLDILCLNQCKDIYDENSTEFKDFRIKVEKEFYRGVKVKWWNFYFCDKETEKPFVKRDKYKNVKIMIRYHLRNSDNMCVVLNLFHDPGCGGTTLAMHVMWDLRQEFRCAVLKENALPKALPDIAKQLITLMKLESEKPSPVLLLIDDCKERENLHDLVTFIRKAAVEDSLNGDVDNTPNCKVIILNCVRSHSPKNQYMYNQTHSQFITNKLTQEEQMEFDKKLKDIEATHEKPENFYSFMIMKNNFDQGYINKIVRDTLEKFDFSTKEARLFAFLALLNTYVPNSDISLSLCEDFLGMKYFWCKEETIFDRMKPYSNFLITAEIKEIGQYKGIRIQHHCIASASLEELERSFHIKVSDIAMEILHYDQFFCTVAVKQRFMLSIEQMLIKRPLKKNGGEREAFSHLIAKINLQEGRQIVQEIFEKASTRFVTSASIPQALARYLYINEFDFQEALKWAEKAKNIKENPFTFDTIGQVHKSCLKSNIQREKLETTLNPEDLNTNIKIANNAIRAFKRAQDLANTENELVEEISDDESEDYPRKSYSVYGYVGVLEIVFLVFEILSKLPFFEENDPLKKRYLRSFLEKIIHITNVYKEDNVINSKYMEIIKEHEQFLQNLKNEAKEIFNFLDCYYTYIKGNNSEFDAKNRWTVCSFHKKYASLFCSTPEEMTKERQNKPNLNLKMDIEESRMFLEQKQADTFAGIFQYLDKPAEEIEAIIDCYAFLQQQQFINKTQKTKYTINYILSNIVLFLLKPRSKQVRNYSFLSSLLLKTLQEVGYGYTYPDPYYLYLLLFWPSPGQENTEIVTYVRAIRKSFHKHLKLLFRKRSTVAHFYLGKQEGLKRLVSKPQLDENFKEMQRHTLAQLWRNGHIFKHQTITDRLHRVSGTVEQGEVFANYGQLKIPVRPALIAVTRSGFSTEKVSFYLGFAIDGPLAYDIQYEN